MKSLPGIGYGLRRREDLNQSWPWDVEYIDLAGESSFGSRDVLAKTKSRPLVVLSLRDREAMRH